MKALAFVLLAAGAMAQQRDFGVWRAKAIITNVCEVGTQTLVHDEPAATRREAMLKCRVWLDSGLTVPDPDDATGLIYPARAVARCTVSLAQ